MPVILGKDDYDVWLDPGMNNLQAVSERLKPFDARMMKMFPISCGVNLVKNDDAECAKQVTLHVTQRQFFA